MLNPEDLKALRETYNYSDNPPYVPKVPAPTIPKTRGAKAGNTVVRNVPHFHSVQKVRSLLFETIKPLEWKKIKTALLAKCYEGDTKALSLLLAYTLGKPLQTIDIDLKQTNMSPEEAKIKISQMFGITEPPITRVEIEADNGKETTDPR